MVEYIEYKGKKLPVRVSYYALKKIKAEMGKGLEDLKEADFDVYEMLLFYGLERGHKITETEFPFKKEDMEDIMDMVFYEFIELIPKFFPGASFDKFKALPEQVQKKEVEKKSVK